MKDASCRRPGIDLAADALVLVADALDHGFLQLAHGDAAAEVSDFGRGGVRVHRAADQRQRRGLRLGVLLRQIGGGGERQRHRLANRDNMGVGTQFAHEVHEVEGVVLNVEFTCRNRDVAGVVPVRHIDFTVPDQTLHGGAQESGVMAGHRGNQQHLARLFLASADLEMDEIAKGALHHIGDFNHVVLAVFAGEGGDAPVGFHHHALVGTFRHFAPGGHPAECRVWQGRKDRVRCHGEGRGAQPLVGVPDGLHQIVGHHVPHALPPSRSAPASSDQQIRNYRTIRRFALFPAELYSA